jgi:carbon-monoxide dehydrogenase medium subunit
MAAVVVDQEDDRIKTARIALGGVSDRPVRASGAERALVGTSLTTELAAEAGEIAASEIEPIGDIHGSAEYRRDLIRVLTKRALQQAISG